MLCERCLVERVISYFAVTTGHVLSLMIDELHFY